MRRSSCAPGWRCAPSRARLRQHQISSPPRATYGRSRPPADHGRRSDPRAGRHCRSGTGLDSRNSGRVSGTSTTPASRAHYDQSVVTKLGIMIEGQEGLNWERWRRLCHDVEALGFESLRRSEHLISLMGHDRRDCIDCWTSLALAAEWTKKITFGPMVSPMTFHHPAILARKAAAVDVLSHGRLILGVGAGWNP